MKNKTNLELMELYSNGDFLSKKELKSRVAKRARAKTGNIYMIIGFIPKTNKNDKIVKIL